MISIKDTVPPDWVDGKHGVTVEEWGQREYDLGRKAGLNDGLDKAINFLYTKAGENFRIKKDELAIWFRSAAEIIETLKVK